jgi:hypothetical protein
MMREKLVLILSAALGMFFIIAGIGKIFSFGAFASTVSEITYLAQSTSTVLAVAVIAIEILGGVGLFLRYKTTLLSILFCILIALFLWVLSMAIIQGKEIECQCFGILNIGLSNRAALIVDLVLFNLFALLALISSVRKSPPTLSQKVWLAVTLAAVFYLQYSAFAPMLKERNLERNLNLQPVLSLLKTHHSDFASNEGENRLLFLLYFPDFNCPPCFDEFMTLADILQTRFPNGQSKRLLALFKPDAIADPADPTRLHRWAEANKLFFPTLIAHDSLFQQANFFKSAVAVISPSERILFSEVLPMGPEKLERVIKLLEGNYDSNR